MKEVRIKTRVQVDALRECIDLVRNGYIQKFAVYQPSWWFIKYRHMVNGRTLYVEWKPDRFCLKEDGLILKSVGELEKVH